MKNLSTEIVETRLKMIQAENMSTEEGDAWPIRAEKLREKLEYLKSCQSNH